MAKYEWILAIGPRLQAGSDHDPMALTWLMV